MDLNNRVMENRFGPPEIEPNEVELFETLGKGSFGTVYRGKCRSKEVAVKILHFQVLDEKALDTFRQEVQIMNKIYHPNIVLFMGACTIPTKMMIVTELLPRGDLETMLYDPKVQLSLLQRMKMAKDAALGMTWLHGSNPQIMHRDFKPSNLLVDENNRIKICDFGLSQVKPKGENLRDREGEGAKGTPLWMAPEVLMGLPFNEKADVYSFGICLWQILTREEPFTEFQAYDQFANAVCLHNVRPPIPRDCNPYLQKMIERCWDRDPQLRPPFSKIVDALDHIIVEIAISDDVGKKLWKDRFLKKEQVTWKEFEVAFNDLLYYFGNYRNILPENPTFEHLRNASSHQLTEFSNRSPQHKVIVSNEFQRRMSAGGVSHTSKDEEDELKIRAIKLLLVEHSKNEDTEIVTMEKFGNILVWFGPIVDAPQQVVILDNIYSILSKDWFHGELSQSEAENRLASRDDGTFLIRFSSIVGCYTVSRISNRKIIHQRIYHQPGKGFEINQEVYRSLVDLVEKSFDRGMKHSCPGSSYRIELLRNPAEDNKVANYVQYFGE